MIITLQEAKDVLRLSTDDNNNIITAMILTIPSYIETATGSKSVAGSYTDLEKQVAKFILMQWYDPASENNERISKVINTLLTAITVNVNKNNKN